MLCSIYADKAQANRFLLVRRDAAFPAQNYNRRDWRLLVIGAEPHNELARVALARQGYYEYSV